MLVSTTYPKKRHHYASLKCKVILSQGVPNHGFSGLKAIWFNNNAVHRIFDNHPETTHKHVFFYILSTSSNSSHKRPKAQIRLYRMDIELS